jgi:hypothetical protein
VPLDLAGAIGQLDDRQSARRRAAAKRLRVLADPAAGPALLLALDRELKDIRAWETQYQMVMALATSGHRPALGVLKELAVRPFDATMVYVAIGDSIVRLGRDFADDPAPVDWCLATGNDQLADGALRAVAMLRLRLDEPAIGRILAFLAPRDPYDGLRFWPAAAAAGWEGPAVQAFLTQCANGPRQDVAEAARPSLAGKYQTYRPL